MAFQLSKIAPWGRSLEEYVAMFLLSKEDLGKRILGCGDGPASFNAELTRQGGTVVSVDPLYAYDASQIRGRIDESFGEVLQQLRENRQNFIWEHFGSVERLGEIRMAVMRDFLADYPQGRTEGRYLPSSASSLSFADDSFELALCSHLLFLYSDQLDLQFHIDAIAELCRVSREVRIFPIVQLGAAISPYLQPVTQYLQAEGYEVSRVRALYEFQRGGNEMLQIKRAQQDETDSAAPRPA